MDSTIENALESDTINIPKNVKITTPKTENIAVATHAVNFSTH